MGWEDRDYYKEQTRVSFRPLGFSFGRFSVVLWLIGLNAGIFLLDGILARVIGPVGVQVPGRVIQVAPLEAWGFFSVSTVFEKWQIWRIVTFQFVHGGLLHLLGNVLGLFFLGPMIEQHFGSKRFLAFYLLCGVGGVAAYLLLWSIGLFVTSPYALLIGASAGVFGIIMAAAIIAPDTRVLLFFLIPIPLRVLLWGLVFIAVFVVLAQGADPGSNAGGEAAHIGGFLTGLLFIKAPRLLDWADRFSLSSIQAGVNKGRFERKQRSEREQQAEVDRILDKVREHGLASLSRKEKKMLNRATERQRRAD